MIFHFVFSTTVLTILIHLTVTRRQGFSADRVFEVCLLYLLTIQWGFGGMLMALPHILVPDIVAGYIGWPEGSPFQVELGFASLGISALGALCFWLRGTFWLAPVIAQSTFLLGAAYVHILDAQTTGNLNPGNVGPVLFYDIAMPAMGIGLLIAHYRNGGLMRPAATPAATPA